MHTARQILPALVQTFEDISTRNGDAEAYDLSKVLCAYKFIVCLYMLCNILHIVAILQDHLRGKVLAFYWC